MCTEYMASSSLVVKMMVVVVKGLGTEVRQDRGSGLCGIVAGQLGGGEGRGEGGESTGQGR